MDVTFYGVRGSLPAPASGEEVQAQLAAALYLASKAGARFDSPAAAHEWLNAHLPFHQRSHYGGDTTCILVRCGAARLIVDAGSGIRRLGRDLMPEVLRAGRLDAHLLFTHVHMDHVTGFPFLAPLFLPRSKFAVRFTLYGGTAWGDQLRRTLGFTVSPPAFPVDLEQIRREGAAIDFFPIQDGLTLEIADVRVTCRRLHHPNEAYGFRIEHQGRVFVVATDTEPYAAAHPALMELAAHADLLYVDSQYDWAQYSGDYDRVSRVGWGHGYAEWCGRYAREAKVRLAVMGHHDPAANNQRIHDVGEKMRAEFPATVVGFDGLQVRIGDREVVAVGAGEGGGDWRVPR
jgi:phosphoribosyl 1,2-cyclic phosphodiesterase